MGRQDFSWTVVIFKVLSYFSVETHVFCTYSFDIQTSLISIFCEWKCNVTACSLSPLYHSLHHKDFRIYSVFWELRFSAFHLNKTRVVDCFIWKKIKLLIRQSPRGKPFFSIYQIEKQFLALQKNSSYHVKQILIIFTQGNLLLFAVSVDTDS